ncbi:cytochrome b [Ovoidimarina sediminis]|uniref:cytochrome b n=1 Tax=Ovoidimarina sediminis TaxID=3079856 RepID=UPI00290BC3D1|nr:cytochrome b [Rhodophyticola sp. MJ-SS7]MDU8946057.1 cytochrome b [Rhodophyticola sp. MJ-SS7]
MFRNTAEGYGLVSRVLHWAIAAGVVGMMIFGTRIAAMEPSLSNYWLYGVHKSFGLTILGLVLIRLVWHRISPVPEPAGMAGTWQHGLARGVHILLYLFLLAIPVSGWVASSATGIDTVFFNIVVMPAIAPPSEVVAAWGFAVHGALWKGLLALIALHVAGALRHGFGPGSALRRMGRG